MSAAACITNTNANGCTALNGLMVHSEPISFDITKSIVFRATNDFQINQLLSILPSFEMWEQSIKHGGLINEDSEKVLGEDLGLSILLSSVLKKRRSKMSKHQRKKRRKRDRMKNLDKK